VLFSAVYNWLSSCVCHCWLSPVSAAGSVVFILSSGAHCKCKTGLVNMYSVSAGPFLQFNATSNHVLTNTQNSWLHKKTTKKYHKSEIIILSYVAFDDIVDYKAGRRQNIKQTHPFKWVCQTQKTAVWYRSHRGRPISRELSIAPLDQSPVSQLWRLVLYLQRIRWYLCLLVTVYHCKSSATVYIVSQKNDTDVAHYNLDTDQPIFIILGENVAERVCYQMVIWYSAYPN